ncbi:MAG: UDP-N-acetylmuramoyl-L-alanyl-D-glutamate--2,6-diaminopimelate ligase [Rhodobacteraceae bacterium]|nr:UDP-N-acetylmuramoyl-L-alanyl-D-glutamate--2,6-diaminopimelate ligase [Paracoccaceae bacterium]
MAFPAKALSALGLTARGGANPTITGVSVDSRDVKPGHLFAAMPGTNVHGGAFIQYALRMGAAAVLTDAEGARIAADELAAHEAALVLAERPREALSRTAALFFDAQPATMVAVTGTNGKTSVSTFVRQIWELMGIAGVNLGTTGVEGAWTAPLAHTTPEPITLHRTLAEAAAHGVTHAAMEASSHGLDQRRLDGVVLKAAGFTNFTQDHLDYHASFDAYFDAKAGLFARVLPEEGVAVINVDDPRGVDMAAIATARGQQVMTIGKDGRDIALLGQRFDGAGQVMRFRVQDKVHQTRLDLIGGFQAENVLMALGLVIAAGGNPETAIAALPDLKTVRGRMEHAATRANEASVFVDYSHTPDAVATALKALRPHVMGKLVVVVGAGGDRDPFKRPLMGAAAAEHADVVFVTDDNPRSEDPAEIRAAVMEGCPEATEVADRAEAILRAVDTLEPGDIALIAGKGHETGQIVGDDVLPFDDVEQASIAVAALDGGGL